MENKNNLKEKFFEHLVVGGMIFGCGVVAVVDTVAVKPYMFIKELMERQRD